MAARLSPPPPYDTNRISIDDTLKDRPSSDAPRGRSQHIDLPNGARMSAAPLSPVRLHSSEEMTLITPSSARIETASSDHARTPSRDDSLSLLNRPISQTTPEQASRLPPPPQHGVRLVPGVNNFSRPKSPLSFERSFERSNPDSPQIVATDVSGSHSHLSDVDVPTENEQQSEPLQYFHARGPSDVSAAKLSDSQPSPDSRPRASMLSRPMSAMMLEPGRSPSPGVSPNRARESVYGRRSPANRPMSYIDLLNAPYPQPAPSASNLHNDTLRPSVGLNASLLSSQRTFEMYLANVKKTSDLQVQYSFAVFLIRMAQEARNPDASRPSSSAGPPADDSPLSKPKTLVDEARKIFDNLAGKSYPFAQYYLADGYTSGLFTKSGEPDNDRALPLFVASSKHGHAEAGYRAGLCYEFGWGTRRDGPKAWQYFRASASRGHPGAMARLSRACLTGDLGQPISQREGVRWLRLAAEKADEQFNSAPYELGLLHEHGFGDDVFKDEAFTAQMFTRSSELGHIEASYRMAQAYEHGLLKCPNDSALSIHFYNSAALGGHSEAMLGLAAWYLLGSEVLEKDETEAFEWASKAAEAGNPKGIFTVGWFRETGTGCRRDPLEANVCYVKAADLGYERAKQRIKAINAAASSGNGNQNAGANAEGSSDGKKKGKKGEDGEKKKKKLGLF